MSFILIPNKGDDVQVNAWNWRQTLELLWAQDIITSEHAQLLACNGCGATVDAALAERIAAVVENTLARLAPGDRVRVDFTVTSGPKVPQVFGPGTQPSDIDVTELYSATYDWLVTFKDFCKRCDGFEVS
jgi:hypothetical protein